MAEVLVGVRFIEGEAYIVCTSCGQAIPVSNPFPEALSCISCGQSYVRVYDSNPGNPKKLGNPEWSYFFGGLLVGFIGGAFIWTHLGRTLVVEAIKRGAAVTAAKVEEWIAKGMK